MRVILARPSDLGADMSGPMDRRRSERIELATDIEFRRKREAHYTIRMHDLTPHGCKIAPPERVDAGELVWVQLPSLQSLSSRVKWTGDWQSGIEFDRPMHPAVFAMLSARLAPSEA
jgi:hypothetical protein